ncbi:synaptonemal complex protein 2 isoform X8 [Xyrichtys novacula]|uniref:Synaptonemal complex protein 2 isoform X8 n=1 Tax=Xyrichtys novacula TaxID=13765 RepID=A0AAV1HK67_XYRNO|nr:synaptonemal complex protein 2 isoform X8 [Xyrichtys novacula]
MAPGGLTQLEKVIEEVLKSGDVRSLDAFLRRDITEWTPIKCAQRLLTSFDKLFSMILDQKDLKAAGSCFNILYKCGKNLKLPNGGEGLSGLIAQGLVKKISIYLTHSACGFCIYKCSPWFEKCRQLLIQCGPRWNETLFNLLEDFFDVLMVVHEACKEGTYKITEFFLYPVGQLAVDPRIYILFQKEAIRKFNLILDKVPAELKKKKKILPSQEASDLMIKFSGQILEGGDYDLQTALMEALCRMASPNQRKELAERWFSMGHVASAFVKISDTEFETDCRKFLNLVNGMQGDKRRVYSYPCLEAYLDKYELLIPSDDKLEEFWIDFNLGSHSISFYFSLADEEAQEGQWETISITENEVLSYTVTEEGKRKVLQLKLSEVVVVGSVEGSSLTIHFSSSLDILQAAQRVYGHSKSNGFVKKTGASVAETTINILMEENSSQVVPESQVSLRENTAPCPLPTSSAPVQMVIPAKMKISESSTIFSCGSGVSAGGARSHSAVTPTNASAKGKGKPSLEMVRSSERQGELYLEGLRTTARAGSCSTIPNPTLAENIKEQGTATKQAKKNNNKNTKTADSALAGRGEEKSFVAEPTFVPDTQPRAGGNISSYWTKLSVSEVFILPTQKMSSLPRTEPLSSDQQLPSSVQRVSVAAHKPINQKKFHAELTQSLQQILNKKSKDQVPEEPAAPQQILSDTREEVKGRSFAEQRVTKEQRVQKIEKSKGQKSPEKDNSVIKAPTKASTSKAIHKEIPPKEKAESKRALTKKEKRDAALAGSMVKLISSHYENYTKSEAKASTEKILQSSIPPQTFNRQVFSMSWLSAATKKESGVLSKCQSKTSTSFIKQREDVYALSTDEAKRVVGKEKTFNNTSVISSSSINDSSALIRTTKQEQLVAKQKWHGRKHLFSDTDTDYATTEVSWLRESGRKPKPKVTKYSRPANVRPKAVSPHTSFSHSVSLLNQKTPSTKERVEQPKKTVKPAAAPSRPHAAGRRPQRAAVTSVKTYREPDTDDSQSESEKPAAPKTKDISLQKPEKSLSETSKLNKKSVAPVEEQINSLKDSWAARQTSFHLPPPFIERMRSAERSAPTSVLTCSPLLTPRGSPLPASPDPPCQDTPSPILLLPRPRASVSSRGNLKLSSYYSAEKKLCSSKSPSIQSIHSLPSLTPRGRTPAPSDDKISLIQQHPPSPNLFHLPLSAQPLLTSTLLEQDNPAMPSPPLSPFPEETVSHGYHLSLSKVSSVSLSQSSSKSSVHSRSVQNSLTAAFAVSHEKEKTPSDQDLMSGQRHTSGPSRKRHISSSSGSDEDEKEDQIKHKRREQPPPRMKPRKLFKSYTEISVESEMSQVMSPPQMMSSSHGEADTGDGDLDMAEDFEMPKMAISPKNLCQQFSSELKKKFENRQDMVEVYNKQCLKTLQQHVSSLNMRVTKQRTERLEQVQAVLLEEIHKLEQDETVLRNMEKDLTMYWKKQITTFCSYHAQDTRRNETLAKALQSNVCPELEYEERLFTSQMCLIRKDMKSVQDRLLSQMQEVEIQSVKRGLQALFFP